MKEALVWKDSAREGSRPPMKPVNSRCHAGWPDFKLPKFQPARRPRGCPGLLSPQGSQEEPRPAWPSAAACGDRAALQVAFCRRVEGSRASLTCLRWQKHTFLLNAAGPAQPLGHPHGRPGAATYAREIRELDAQSPDEKRVSVRGCEAPLRAKLKGPKLRVYASLGTLFR